MTIRSTDSVVYMYGVEQGEILGATAESLQIGDEIRVDFRNVTTNYPPTYGNPVRTTLLRHAGAPPQEVKPSDGGTVTVIPQGGFGQVLIALIAVIAGALALRSRQAFVRGPALVLRKFALNESSTAPVALEIVGRASGLVAWVMTVVGIDAETSLEVTHAELLFKSSGISGAAHQVVPLEAISSSHCGYSRSVWLLILSAMVVLIATVTAISDRRGAYLVAGLILAGPLLIGYVLSKKLAISVETSGGRVVGLTFKRSVIENVSVDLNEALKAIRLINNRVLSAKAAQ